MPGSTTRIKCSCFGNGWISIQLELMRVYIRNFSLRSGGSAPTIANTRTDKMKLQVFRPISRLRQLFYFTRGYGQESLPGSTCPEPSDKIL